MLPGRASRCGRPIFPEDTAHQGGRKAFALPITFTIDFTRQHQQAAIGPADGHLQPRIAAPLPCASRTEATLAQVTKATAHRLGLKLFHGSASRAPVQQPAPPATAAALLQVQQLKQPQAPVAALQACLRLPEMLGVHAASWQAHAASLS